LTSRDTPGQVAVGQDDRAAGSRPPRVYLHIGEPKTGSTFLQHVIWGNRARLAAQGIVLPGYTRRDHSRASRDLRESKRLESDVADPWTGEWDVLRRQALRAPRAAIISDELLVGCNPQQADRAVRSLLSAELHLILTVRDFAALLPAEWQETVKVRRTASWEQWLGSLVECERAADRRERMWFWRAHDTLATLNMWTPHLPPDRVHVITMPRHSSADVLWGRFASVFGIDSDGIDLTDARANSSLGLPESEFLRRMNQELSEEIPDWYYTRYIKQILAHGVLTEQPRQERLVLPPGRVDWAKERSEAVVTFLRDSKCHIVGDLDDLVPEPAVGQYLAPDQQPAEQILEVAMRAVAVLAHSRYREMYPAKQRSRRRVNPRQMANRLVWGLLNGSRTKRMLRNASHYTAVRRLRVAIWWVLMRPTSHRHAVTTGKQGTGPGSAVWLAGGRPSLNGIHKRLAVDAAAEPSSADSPALVPANESPAQGPAAPSVPSQRSAAGDTAPKAR
jgi:hypothetical protein